MEQLPVELIEKILITDILDVGDVINVSLISRDFQHLIINNNTIWRSKFMQKFPTLWNKLEIKPVVYYEELRHVYQLKDLTRSILEDMAQKFYKKVELSNEDLKDWDNIIRKKWDNYFYLAVDLMDIIHTKSDVNTPDFIPVNLPGNLTQKFYAAKVLRFIRQIYLERMWHRYLRKPLEHRLLENGAILVSQWCQADKEIKPEVVHNTLDELAEMVKSELKTICPQHPLFKATKDQFDFWKFTALSDSAWDSKDCRLIICVISEVLFRQLQFINYSDRTPLSLPDESYFYIDAVLKSRNGMREVLAIIYEAVARRLGLKCEVVLYSTHFFLRFWESHCPDFYYIDISSGGQIVKKGSCPFSSHTASLTPKLPGCRPEEVIIQLTKQLEYLIRQTYSPSGRVTKLRSVLELTQLVNPNDFSALIGLATLYMQHNFSGGAFNSMQNNTSAGGPRAQRLVEMIREYNPDPSEDFTPPIRRPADNSVKFAVGMVMGHKFMNYKCVIFNWDSKCLAASDWKLRNNINSLNNKDKQPFYNVLVEGDGSHRYVAQENLFPINEPLGLQLDDEVGRYFTHYYQTYYVPNVQTEYYFPDDGRVRNYYDSVVRGILFPNPGNKQ